MSFRPHCVRTLVLLTFALLGTAAPLSAGFLGFGAPKDADVNVVVDMTDAGRKVAPPTKEKPAFYFPVLAGYREAGSLVAGEKTPPQNNVAKLLAKALAAQHYYVMGTTTPGPTIILVFHWGYMNPQIDDTGDDERDFVGTRRIRLPAGELAHMLLGDAQAITVADDRFEHDP